MNKSESIKEIATALCGLQAEITNPKNTADNPFFKSKYAPLNDILNDARPLLSKHGLSILQSPSGNGSDIIISSLVMHKSGEWIEPEPLILKADKPTAQGAGSAITYGRRYAISAILGISSEDDDDGNGAEPSQNPPQQHKPIGNDNNSSKPEDTPKNDSAQPSDIEKRATKIFFICTGDKSGQHGWSQDKYKKWLKDLKDKGHISTDYGKKWTLDDVKFLETHIKELPF